MTCAEFKEHVAAYALGALESEERRACDEHLGEGRHEGCLEELGRMSAAAHGLAASLPPVKPGAHVWKGVEERIGVEAGRSEPGGGGRRWREALAWGLAVAAVFVIWLLLKQKDQLEERVAALDSQRMLAQADAREQERLKGECKTELARTQVGALQKQVLAALEQKGTQLAALGAFTPDVTGFGGNVVVNAEQRFAYLVGNGFKPQPGRKYQLWVLPDMQTTVPAGFLEPDQNGNAVAVFDPKVLDQAKAAFAVSLEENPADGKPDKVLLAAIPPKTQ